MKKTVALLAVACLLCVLPVFAAIDAHADPITLVALSIAVILLAAKLGGDIAVRLGQPSVLGELLVGVLLGNLTLLSFTGLDYIKNDPTVEMLARLGVLVLLFEVGLESTVGQMLKVGIVSSLVAILGVIAPFALGWAVGSWLLPEANIYVHAFLGATLCATSVGITARVLQDLKHSNSVEARIILGAAVIDDVLGLVILAVVTGMITTANAGTSLSYASIVLILVKAVGFLAISLVVGVWLAPRLFSAAARLRTRGVLLALGLSFCFLLAWLSGVVGLAPIVGAYAAGLILEDTQYADLVKREEHSLEQMIHPITSFLVPIFFVLMGMRTDLTSFLQPGVLLLATALTIVAIIGKQACSLGAFGHNVDRLSIGIGMVPRGEVGLIFANIGAQLTSQGRPVIDHSVFSAVVVMVVVTTFVTPPALKWSLGRNRKS